MVAQTDTKSRQRLSAADRVGGVAHRRYEGGEAKVVVQGPLDDAIGAGHVPDKPRQQALAFDAEVGQQSRGPEGQEVGVESGVVSRRIVEIPRDAERHHQSVVVVPRELAEAVVTFHAAQTSAVSWDDATLEEAVRKYAFPLLALVFLGIAWVLTQFSGDDEDDDTDSATPTPAATETVTVEGS